MCYNGKNNTCLKEMSGGTLHAVATRRSFRTLRCSFVRNATDMCCMLFQSKFKLLTSYEVFYMCCYLEKISFVVT